MSFRLVLFESGFSSVENLEHIKLKPSQVFQKLLKSNAAVANSPARRLASPAHQVFASILAVFKREPLKMRTKLHHFALKSRLYLKAVRATYEELQLLRTA